MKSFIVILLILGSLYYTFTRDSAREEQRNSGKTAPISTSGAGSKASAPGIEEKKYISLSERPHVILFTGTSWCPACRTLQSRVLSTPEWRNFANSEIRFTVYNISNNANSVPKTTRDLMTKYGVRAFPTMVLVDKQGNKVSESVGAGSSVGEYRGWIAGRAAAL